MADSLGERSGHTRVVVVIPYRDVRNLYKWTKIVSRTCGTDAQNGTVRMRITEFGGKPL